VAKENNILDCTILQCPSCKVRELESTITQKNILSTVAYCPPDFLEILGEHEHDKNYILSSFICSRAHEFVHKLSRSCHCGWIEE
jgi:hypothetical protein